MASKINKTATTLQAQAYLRDLGYTNPDASEIQGAIEELNSDPATLSKYAAVGDTEDTAGADAAKLEETWLAASKTGITRDQFNALNPMQQATIAAAGEVASGLYATGSTGVTLADALRRAASDPSIISRYSDSLKLDQNSFADSLVELQDSVSDDVTKNRLQFQTDKEALDRATSAAGTAYSGYANRARENLAETESGIITSSRSKAQSDLNKLTKSFAEKYGSAALPPASLSLEDPRGRNGLASSDTITSTIPKNIIGSDNPAKSADIASLAKSFYDTAQTPSI